MTPNDNNPPKENNKSCNKENMDHIDNNIDCQEKIWNTELGGYQYNKTYRIIARILIGILLLSCLFGISFAIVLGIKLYHGSSIFFTYKDPLLEQISNQKKEESHNNSINQYDLDQSLTYIHDNQQIKNADNSEKSNGNNKDLNQINQLISDQKHKESKDLYKQENVSVKLFNEEIYHLKRLILNINKSYDDIKSRLEKTEKIIENPLKNSNIQRMISLIIINDSINRGEYPFDKKMITDGISILDPCTSVLMKFANAKIPTLLEIALQFPKVSEEMIAETESMDKDMGFIKYLFYQLKKLIKVRFIGNTEGDNITALISRIENNLKNGDLIKASSEWDKIPEKAQKPGIFLRNAIDAHICSDKIIKEELAKISNKNL
ncbi:COG4223 family protein [Candidatus Liberibacter americanus]|uniref:Uncharacterized protein n=1 Tax=Candidatus Liberibacter americanus str. Sao Paulo TaxID=1261131 RepID=U6B5N2_9HYPH|nr:hypothetical protein [Candidatus Liberibacter americanus]AHA28128.1 hypothetical protein lam_785 [Candidatus Liberibacter americanus str. Sao Paulo]EMS36025.1 hypothetical protein G653_03491 [Candidatus Liberibacter americanus PW_SP]